MNYKRSLCTLLIPLVLIGLLVAACGSTSGSNPPSANATTTPSGSNSLYPTPTPPTVPTPTATTAASSGPVVKTASATIQGKTTTILTDAQGRTLYYYKPDTATSATCTGGCAQNWPPLLFSGSGSPTSSTQLSGTLSVVQGANGAQVEYQGHPLYTFAGDSASGQVNGEGKGNVWFAATTDLQSQS